MADSQVAVTPGSGANIDTRTEATNGQHRQVIVIGDPSINAGVAPVDATNGLSVTLTTAIPAGSATIGALTANQTVNIAQINGVTPLMGAGNTGTGSPRFTIATDQAKLPFHGTVAHDSVDADNPVKIGHKARQTNPAAVADADRVDSFADDVGRPVVVLNQCRDLVGNQPTTITNTNETTIITAGGSGVFNDLTHLTITNSNASTDTVVTLKDSTGGTTRGIYQIPARGGIVLSYSTPKKQGTANNNWTVTCSTGVSSIYVVAEFVINV